MIVLRHVLSAPVVVFAVAATGFVAWVASDTRSPTRTPPTSVAETDTIKPPGPPHAIVLSALHPGAPRAFIERRLIVLPPPIHEPIDLSGGSPVCRVRYVVYLSHPVPQLQETLHKDFVPGPHLLTLEFDGGADGQPLIRAVVSRSH